MVGAKNFSPLPSCVITTMMVTMVMVTMVMVTTATAQVDSTEAYRSDPSDTSEVVIVSADRLRSAEVSGVRSVTTLTGEMIRESGASDLGDALSMSPGVFIRRYGGAGALATISLRGTASNGTKVLVDGLPYRSSADGGSDLGSIPVGDVREITVIRGGDGALYGSNALGGVVNVETGGSGADGVGLRAKVGAFGERAAAMLGAWSGASGRVDLYLGYAGSEGDYPFDFREFGETIETRRENSRYDALNGRVSWRKESSAGEWSPRLTVAGFLNERGVPGAVTQGSRERLEARVEEREVMASGAVERASSDGLTQIAVRSRLNDLRYRDPEGRFAGPEGVDTRYFRSDILGTLRRTVAIDHSSTLRASLEIDHALLRGDNLDPNVGESVQRLRLGGMLHGDHRFDSLPIFETATIDAGLRGEYYSDLGLLFSPSIGIALQPTSAPIHLRGHVSLLYRAPTFQEQYYLNLGNADLDVERAFGATLGATWLPTADLLLELSLFRIDTRDRIISIPRSPVSWTTLNIGRVLSRGVELGLRGEIIPDRLTATAAYTRMETTDRSGGITDGQRVPYAPDEVATLLLVSDLDLVSLSTTLTYTSHRHTLTWNTAESALPRYALLDLGLRRELSLGAVTIEGALGVSNVLDKRHEVIRGYPMPGRGWFLEVGVGL